MVVKYTNIFNSNALQNIPNLRFLVLKHTIWQPWWEDFGRDKAGGNYACTENG
jgi:hypothetical protein